MSGDDLINRSEAVQRRPEYIERLEKALLGQIFGTENESGALTGGILDAAAYPDLFRVAPYRMAGQMGNVRVTTQGLEVVKIDTENNLILIKGAVPGATGSDVIISPAVKSSSKG